MVRSGPAGGVVRGPLVSRSRSAEPHHDDIGGTTADVSVITNGEATYTQQTDLAWTYR